MTATALMPKTMKDRNSCRAPGVLIHTTSTIRGAFSMDRYRASDHTSAPAAAATAPRSIAAAASFFSGIASA